MGPQSYVQSLATIRRALEQGINWIDTSAIYGLGQAETLIAKALDDVSRRDRPHVFTTCGFVWDDLGNVSCTLEPLQIRREAEASLRRLNVESIDLYQLDLPVGPTCLWTYDPGQLDEAWGTMGSLQREGKVRFIGVANAPPEDLNRLEDIAPVTSLQAPVLATATGRRDDDVPPLPQPRHWRHRPLDGGGGAPEWCDDAGPAASVAVQRLASSLRVLPTRCRDASPNVVERIRKVAARHAHAPAAVAVAWRCDQRAVTAVAVGARRPEQVDEIARAASLRLSPSDRVVTGTGGGHDACRLVLTGARSFDLQLRHPELERGALHPQPDRGARRPPTSQLASSSARRMCSRSASSSVDNVPAVFSGPAGSRSFDSASGASRCGPRDKMTARSMKFSSSADVAGPRVARQRLHDRGRDRLDRPVHAASELLRE